jgi:hypothetical protein
MFTFRTAGHYPCTLGAETQSLNGLARRPKVRTRNPGHHEQTGIALTPLNAAHVGEANLCLARRKPQ